MFNLYVPIESDSAKSGSRCAGCGTTLSGSEHTAPPEDAPDLATSHLSGGKSSSRSVQSQQSCDETFTIQSQGPSVAENTNQVMLSSWSQCLPERFELVCSCGSSHETQKVQNLLNWFESQLHVEMFLQTEMFEKRIAEVESRIAALSTGREQKCKSVQVCRSKKDVSKPQRSTSTQTDVTHCDDDEAIVFGKSQNFRPDGSRATEIFTEDIDDYTINPDGFDLVSHAVSTSAGLQRPHVMDKKMTTTSELLSEPKGLMFHKDQLDDLAQILLDKIRSEFTSQRNSNQHNCVCHQIARVLPRLTSDLHTVKDSIKEYNIGMDKFFHTLKLLDKAIYHTSRDVNQLRSEQGRAMESLFSIVTNKMGHIEEIGSRFSTSLDDVAVSIEALEDDILKNRRELDDAKLVIEDIMKWKENLKFGASDPDTTHSSRVSRKGLATDDHKIAAKKKSPLRQRGSDRRNDYQEEQSRTLLCPQSKSEASQPDSTSHLYERKRELEARISRVPLNQKRLYDQLANELDAVERQLSKQRLKQGKAHM